MVVEGTVAVSRTVERTAVTHKVLFKRFLNGSAYSSLPRIALQGTTRVSPEAHPNRLLAVAH